MWKAKPPRGFSIEYRVLISILWHRRGRRKSYLSCCCQHFNVTTARVCCLTKFVCIRAVITIVPKPKFHVPTGVGVTISRYVSSPDGPTNGFDGLAHPVRAGHHPYTEMDLRDVCTLRRPPRIRAHTVYVCDVRRVFAYIRSWNLRGEHNTCSSVVFGLCK